MEAVFKRVFPDKILVTGLGFQNLEQEGTCWKIFGSSLHRALSFYLKLQIIWATIHEKYEIEDGKSKQVLRYLMIVL